MTMKDWIVTVPYQENVIGYERDHLFRRLEIQTDLGPEWAVKLDVRKDGKANVIDLERAENVLYVDLTREMLGADGLYAAQLRGLRGETVAHSNLFTLIVADAINGIDQFPPQIPSELAQLEKRLADITFDIEAVSGASAAAAKSAAEAAKAAESVAGAGEAARKDAREAKAAARTAVQAAKEAVEAGIKEAEVTKIAEKVAEAARKAAEGASIPRAQVGAAGGVAALGEDGRIPTAELPKGVEVVESFSGVAVQPTAWVSNTAGGEPPYKAVIPITLREDAKLSAPSAEVLFSVANASAGLFSPACLCTQTAVTLYAYEEVTSVITIPLIRVRRCVL